MGRLVLKPTVKVDRVGRIVIPLWAREQLQIEPGDRLQVNAYVEGDLTTVELGGLLKRPVKEPVKL